jgi:hypothetical protein
MRVVPFGLDEVKQLVVAAAAPVVPLILTIMPFSELMKQSSKSSCDIELNGRTSATHLPRLDGLIGANAKLQAHLAGIRSRQFSVACPA